MSQCAEILSHLKRKPITAIEALHNYRCFRLAARIYDLRSAGYDIDSTMIEIEPGVEVARYSLKSKRKNIKSYNRELRADDWM